MTKIAETVKTKNAETLRNLELAAIPRQTIKPDLQPTRGALNAASAILKQRWNPWNQSAKPAIAAIVSRETCDEELLTALEALTLLISNVAVLYGNDAAKWLMASTAYQKAIEAAQKAKGL